MLPDHAETREFAGGKMLAAKDDGVGLITFNQPEKRNAMSMEMWTGLGEILDEFREDGSVRVVVMTGAGNKAFVSGDISLTFNGVSIYFACKNSQDPKLQAIAADINHQLPPFGVAKRQPQSALVVNAMVFKHTKYPNAAKEYLRFMMEAPPYGPWLAGCLGYWSNSLKNYAKMAFWDSDPKLKPYIGSMDTPYYDGYRGPITAATSAVAANYTLVDMFASVASGNASPESAVKQAARQAARYLKG
ncbi:MAG: enoyl-CoA hydratase/isomerase family protein [Rhodospirillales bacterium]|nr:enoyl-CoA hydratase/isomerase family protein [Rhodospirillales bacterium]